MAETARSILARDGGKSARFGCAGAPRNRGYGCLRIDEQYYASAGCSDRVSVCRGVIRTQLRGASARSGWARRRSVGSCTSFRFLPTSKASWKSFPRFQETSSNFRQMNGGYTLLRGFALWYRLAQSRQKAMWLRPNLSTCRSACEVDCSFGQAQKRTFIGGRVRKGSGCGNNETRVHRGRRIRRERAPAARRPCLGGAHSMHPSWIPWSDHSSARGERARRSDDPSRGIRELGAPRRGLSQSGAPPDVPAVRQTF